ncbi:MAG: SUMF1/EgtB/PvdO family nonheme iron enzyme [Byssovorax sp.]
MSSNRLSPEPEVRPSGSNDSVPPLLASRAEAPRAGWLGRSLAGGLIVLALGAAATLTARAISPPPPARVASVVRVAATDPAPPEAPPPVTLTLDEEDSDPPTLAEQRRRLFAQMRAELGLDEEKLAAIEAVFAASPVLGQGNPAISRHPMSRSECRRIRREAGVTQASVPACGAPGMVPLFDPEAGQTAADARVCIDQLEFPDIPCEYPVVQVRAREASMLCRAVGKRLCDAHEWEGACAGALHAADAEYEWARPRGEASWHHNHVREKVWAHGSGKSNALCATGSHITPGCPGGGWNKCGSNTYPAGAFPLCQSRFGVFDQHGNAAEHMNLPIVPGDQAEHGDRGFTEMKGSWFAFGSVEAHPDDCRWREPGWHETRVRSEASHLNYHLGFRCCGDIER